MLAATPQNSQSLELVKLVLSLISSGNDQIPEPLKQHASLVFSQAKSLAEKPSSVTVDILPESINLALEMRLIDELSKEMEEVSDIESITPALANRLLTTMESRSVYKD